METINQVPLSSKDFRLQPGDSAVSFSPWHKTVLMIAAWFEILVGGSFFLVPEAQTQLLFGATLDGTGVLFARFSGIALIALGTACLPSKHSATNHVAVRVLLIFNIAVAIYFAWIALATTFRGVMLWPVVIMHALIAISLARISARG
jgi:hypothetical protein